MCLKTITFVKEIINLIDQAHIYVSVFNSNDETSKSCFKKEAYSSYTTPTLDHCGFSFQNSLDLWKKKSLLLYRIFTEKENETNLWKHKITFLNPLKLWDAIVSNCK